MNLLSRYGWVAVVLVIVSVIIFNTAGKGASKEEAIVTKENPTVDNDKTVSEIKVDVKGEVIHPGVYEVDAGMRVDDVIEIAGGFTNEADPVSVNLAQKLQDEMIVLVASVQKNTVRDNETEQNKIPLNQATLEEIEGLSGIGSAKAKAILQYREENGMFQSVEDLLDVSGIGEQTLENIREEIRIP